MGVSGDGKDLGAVGGKETVIRKYCTKKNLFSIKKELTMGLRLKATI